jgi:hypothetical protein
MLPRQESAISEWGTIPATGRSISNRKNWRRAKRLSTADVSAPFYGSVGEKMVNVLEVKVKLVWRPVNNVTNAEVIILILAIEASERLSIITKVICGTPH